MNQLFNLIQVAYDLTSANDIDQLYYMFHGFIEQAPETELD